MYNGNIHRIVYTFLLNLSERFETGHPLVNVYSLLGFDECRVFSRRSGHAWVTGPSGSNERIKIAAMNVRSIKPKTAPFSKYVTSKNLDIVAVTETWLKHDETKSTIADISPPGYSFFHEPRADLRAGGGVGILVSDQLKTDIHPLPSFKTFEAISARIGNNSFSGLVVCLYRLQNGPCQFFYEFQDLLENIISLHDNLYILGDFNLHLEWKHQQIH